MAKLTVMKGLPASGKTTLARQMVEKGSTARINRDDLRRMMFNSKWTSHREKIVIDVERAIAQVVLAHSYDAVIDDTNLSKNDIWSGFNTINLNQHEVIDLTTVSLELCHNRDRARLTREGGRVGRAIIDRMALRAGLVPWTKKIVICDIDGTVASLTHRLHFISNPTKKDFDSFFKSVKDDTPIPIVIEWVEAIAATGEFHIVMVSGRSDTCAIETEEWLYRHGPYFDLLLMRRGGDHRPDDLVKQEIYNDLKGSAGFKGVEFVVDDRPRVISMWRANGLKVIPVNQGEWEGRADA